MGIALGALAAVCATALAYRRDSAGASRRVACGSRLVRTARGVIECATHGSGPAVLAIHGAGGGFDQGPDIAGARADVGFRVIAPSRFGYLRTPVPSDASDEAQADAYAAVLDALGIETPRS